MATPDKTLHLIATKIGLGDEERVLRKAAEFERLLQAKTITGVNIPDTGKIVICLDLASFVLGVGLDTKSAIKYSGLKPSTYASSRKVVENLLEINSDRLTVPGLCVKLQCTGVQALAERMLEEYRKEAKMEIDLNLPQYVCMAVHQACRISKVKVSKSKLMEACRLRPAQWGKLEAGWVKFVDENFAAAAKKGRSGRTAVAEDRTTDSADIDECSKEETSTENQTERYEDWKKRMLAEAYEELRKSEDRQKQQIKTSSGQKMEEDRLISPKKNSSMLSPRKHSLYGQEVRTSPRKNNQNSPLKKVSLIFPLSNDRKRMSTDIQSSIKVTPLSPRKDNDELLTLNKDIQFMSPRRSPRKTPQKFSPYKTPVAKNGVRLLFPKNM